MTRETLETYQVLIYIVAILLPFIAAYLTVKWAGNSLNSGVISGLGWLPVPLLAFVIFLIAYSQSNVFLEATSILWYPTAAFVSFLIVAAMLSKAGAIILNLPGQHCRVLTFSFGSRNSFMSCTCSARIV